MIGDDRRHRFEVLGDFANLLLLSTNGRAERPPHFKSLSGSLPFAEIELPADELLLSAQFLAFANCAEQMDDERRSFCVRHLLDPADL